jgi:hypothetical protein
MMSTNTIYLMRTKEGWMADFSASDKAAEVDRLFKTTRLPTAFGPEAHPARVIAEIRRMNPTAEVVAV